jgi:hypothetical protein
VNLFERLAAFTGGMPGISVANVIGVNNDIDTATVPQGILIQGGLYSWPSAAESWEIVSSSASDAAAGTGARTIRLEVLDAAYAPFVVNVTLNGTTPVAVAGSWFRVNDMRITGAVGSSESNVGTITLRVAGGGATRSQMAASKGRAQQAIYTIPAGLTGFASHSKVGIINSQAQSDATVELQTRSFGSGWIVRNTVQISSAGNVSDMSDPPLFPPILEKSDLRFRVTAVSSNNTAVTGVLQLILVDAAGGRVPAPGLARAINPRAISTTS